jgi:hypothetical protein
MCHSARSLTSLVLSGQGASASSSTILVLPHRPRLQRCQVTWRCRVRVGRMSWMEIIHGDRYYIYMWMYINIYIYVNLIFHIHILMIISFWVSKEWWFWCSKFAMNLGLTCWNVEPKFGMFPENVAFVFWKLWGYPMWSRFQTGRILRPGAGFRRTLLQQHHGGIVVWPGRNWSSETQILRVTPRCGQHAMGSGNGGSSHDPIPGCHWYLGPRDA